LAPYAQQGNTFRGLIYTFESGTPILRPFTEADLHNVVIIFIANWCPHCDYALRTWAPHFAKLTARGIRIILVNVPALEDLKSGKVPTKKEHDDTIQKLLTLGVRVGGLIRLVFAGTKATLIDAGIVGLPVILAILDGKERFRAFGNSGVATLNLADDKVVSNFMAIFDSDKDHPKEKYLEEPNKVSQDRSRGSSRQPNNKVDHEVAKLWTELLNTKDLTNGNYQQNRAKVLYSKSTKQEYRCVIQGDF
jgi:thiol-disulfide isomerase/thioredoxin